MTERNLPGPARPPKRCKPLKNRVLPHIEPSGEDASVYLDGDQDAAVETRTAGVEPLQPVNGREPGFGVVEGKKLPVHGAPGRACALIRKPVGDWLGIGHAGRHVRLCGHVGERVGGPDGKDVLLRDLKDRDAGGCLEEAAADQGVLHRQDSPAKAVVVPETALQCAVDEESQHSVCVRLQGFFWVHCLVHGVHWSVCHGSAPFLSWATNSKGSTEYAARSSRRNTIRLMGGTGRSLHPFSSASTASRYAGSEA